MQSQHNSDADGYNLSQNQRPFPTAGCTSTGKSRKSQDVYSWKEKLNNKTICVFFFFFPASEVAQCTTCRYLTNYCGLLSFYFQNHRGCKCNYLASWLKCENTNLVWRQTVTTINSCFSGPCETEEGKVSPLRWSATHSGLQSTKECRQQNLGACMPRLLLCIRCGLYNSKAASDIFWFSH